MSVHVRSLNDCKLELLTEIGAIFKTAQNTFNIKCHRLSVALGLKFLVDSLGIIELSADQILDLQHLYNAMLCVLCRF